VIVCVVFALAEPTFMTWANWQNILRGQAVVLVLAFGSTFVLLSGGMDLSIASMTAAALMIFGLVVQSGSSWLIAALAALALGTALGSINGVLIGWAGFPFFVVTLAGLSIYQGIAYLTTGAEGISLFPYSTMSSLQSVINGNTAGLPTVFLICVGLYAVGIAALRWLPAARSLYAVGSNSDAARIVGINVGLVIALVYSISGLCAGLAGVISAARLSGASPFIDPNLLLTVIAAVLIGGVSLSGGAGGLLGAFIGTLFLAVIQNGLLLSSISVFWHGTVSGLILVGAVAIGVVRDRVRVRAWHSRGAMS
jgi:ribose/xylose/arabinose/galactoside ABC-type transport system permease subunit